MLSLFVFTHFPTENGFTSPGSVLASVADKQNLDQTRQTSSLAEIE